MKYHKKGMGSDLRTLDSSSMMVKEALGVACKSLSNSSMVCLVSATVYASVIYWCFFWVRVMNIHFRRQISGVKLFKFLYWVVDT